MDKVNYSKTVLSRKLLQVTAMIKNKSTGWSLFNKQGT